MPDILYPNIRAGSKKQPLYWYEEQTYYIWCECYTNKKYWKGLKERRGGEKEECFRLFQQISPVYLLMVTSQWFQHRNTSAVYNQGKEMEQSDQWKQKLSQLRENGCNLRICAHPLFQQVSKQLYLFLIYFVWRLSVTLLIQHYINYILLLGKKNKTKPPNNQHHHLLSERVVNI